MKPNLILLHGALGCANDFDPLKGLLNVQFNIYSFDFEGHGANDSEKDFSIKLFAENLEDFIISNSLSPCHIFGYSMGGYVALSLASNRPELIDNIITLGTKFDWTPETAILETKKLYPDKIEEKVPAFASILAKTHGNERWKSVVSRTADMMLGLGHGGAIKAVQFEAIQSTTLITVGSNDQMVSIQESEHITQLIPECDFQVMEGFGHTLREVNFESLSNILIDRLLP